MGREPTVKELQVAKAAYEALFDDKWEDDKPTEHYRTRCLVAAGPSIRAMREPTQEMVSAAAHVYKIGGEAMLTPDQLSGYQAMIDAASPPEAT